MAITKNVSYYFFQCFNKYFIHHPLSAVTSFKFLALILFRDMAFTKFYPFVFQRAVILQGEIIQKKTGSANFSMKNP